jgi:ATP-binding cassette, subfamily C (CFTR/MRP), member 1
VYTRADIILLDDVLAALDSHVARHVMDHVIGHQGLLATKARVVVTHSIAHINRFAASYSHNVRDSQMDSFDTVIYMRRGVILDVGPPDEVLAREESELSKLVRGHSSDVSSSGLSTPRSIDVSRSDDEITTAVGSISAGSTAGSPASSMPLKGRRESFGKAKLLDTLPLKQHVSVWIIAMLFDDDLGIADRVYEGAS